MPLLFMEDCCVYASPIHLCDTFCLLQMIHYEVVNEDVGMISHQLSVFVTHQTQEQTKYCRYNEQIKNKNITFARWSSIFILMFISCN